MAKDARADFYPMPMVDHSTRPGTVTRLIIFILILIASAVVFGLFRERFGDPFLLGMLGVLAMIGVGFLFATAIGFIQVAPRSTGDELSKAFVDSMAQGLVVTDAKNRIIYANRAYADMTGAASAADIRTVEGLLSDAPEASSVIYRLASGLRDGQQGDGEFRLNQSIRPGAEPGARWYRVEARPFRIPGQRQPFNAWKLADISREREEQERFFLDLQKAIDHLDNAPAGFFSTDEDGRVTYVNATLAEWLGIDLASFTPGAVTLSDIVAGDGMALVRSVRPDPGTARNAVIDLDLTTMKGEALPVRFLHRATASRDGHTGPTRTIVLNRTEGDDSSADLRASEVRFTRFFNSTPMAIAGVDQAGRILRTNAPFLSLFASAVDSDALDRRVRLDTVIHERDRPAFEAALEKARQRQADIAPIDTVLPDNEERHIRFYVNAVADGDGAEEAAIVYAVDTTEQKALEAQMAQSQKMQAVGQLAGGIAHDFNNVLTAIIMASDLLLTNHRPSDPSFPDIMNIKQNANRAASLVRQLLAFSRKQTLRPEVLTLTDVLADLRMLLARLVGNDIKLRIDHGRDLWPVKVDIGQFEQVVVNLAVNARDAMPGGGELTVRTRNVATDEAKAFPYRELEAGDYVLVEVEDTGSGIPPDVLKKIFEPFFTTKEVGKGTGLGLSMVYGIIKQTGGFIFCDSEVGKGTTFRIFLPRHIPVAVAQPAGAAEQKPAANGADAAAAAPAKPADTAKDLSGSATVLLVEDEDAVRMGGVRALTSRGYTVHEASSGVEALELFESLEGRVDIVVSDVVMPEMDGPTLLGELRKRQPDVKFVFVSGYAEDAFAKNLPEDAQFGFLPKPFSLKQLATVVKEVLEA
ncbi:cell cycle histidine kinase CckA [Aquamicrobium terrae]|uniref:histidine kinase n=1 Tax=Aquamicrobium terrae TaxID=1324945 RepID=A0ABV2MTT1_9HYPH